MDIQTPEELRQNILEVTFDAVVANLTGEIGAAVPVKEPEPREIVFEGTFEEVNRLFLANGWSDGLPVVPPTPKRSASSWLSPTVTRRGVWASCFPTAVRRRSGTSPSTE